LPTSIRFSLRAAAESEVDWIADQEARFYSAADAVPRETLHEWFATNPNIFNVVSDRAGARVGHFNLVPIKPDRLAPLIAGTICEADIGGDDIFPAKERNAVTRLWLESIVIELASPYLRARALADVFAQAEVALGRVADPAKLQSLYALTATVAGETLTTRLGFHKVSSRTQREDGHDVYRVSFADLQRALAIDT